MFMPTKLHAKIFLIQLPIVIFPGVSSASLHTDASSTELATLSLLMISPVLIGGAFLLWWLLRLAQKFSDSLSQRKLALESGKSAGRLAINTTRFLTSLVIYALVFALWCAAGFFIASALSLTTGIESPATILVILVVGLVGVVRKILGS